MNAPRLPEKIRQVQVNTFDIPTGQLTQPGQHLFVYNQDTPWVSLTMDPGQQRQYPSGALHPAFAQNLPEGYVRHYLFERLRRQIQLNDLYLLALQGHKGVGHLSYDSDIPTEAAAPVSLDDILQWRGASPLFAELLDRYYLNGLVSGVQPKVMVPIVDKTVIQQEDVIVKTFDPEYDLLTVNEFVCMSAARAVGLNPPDFWLSQDLKSFVVRRFDRTPEGERLAQEDFTVLMGKSANDKYHSSYEQVLKVVDVYTRSPEEMERAYRLVAFNILIGNGDAHLKNFSLQYRQDRSNIVLAPPYDITHTLLYPGLDRTLALKISKSKQFPSRAVIERLGLAYGIRHPGQILEAYADQLTDFLQASQEVALLDGLRKSIEDNLASIMQRTGVVVPARDRQKKYT